MILKSSIMFSSYICVFNLTHVNNNNNIIIIIIIIIII